jgi:glycosyltransferase involved in cell wall biosynthesis
MTNANVSYIMPVYNGEQYIRQAIDSILAQTLPPNEIIVVDDVSTAQTAAIVSEYGARVIYRHQNNQGQSVARNEGVKLATGQFIAFLDADDLLLPDKLERQMKLFTARPQLDLCDAHAQNFWSLNFPATHNMLDVELAAPRPELIITWLVKRTLFAQVGMLDQTIKYNENTEWYLRARDNGAVMKTLPDVVASRRLHLNNTSG